MIKLTRPITFTFHIQPIKLPNDCGNDSLFQELTAIGRGRNNDSRTDYVLRHTSLYIIKNEYCNGIFTPLVGNSKSIFCVTSAHDGSIFLGDSGT